MSDRRYPIAFAVMVLLLVSSGSEPALAREVKMSGMGIRKCSEWQRWKDERVGEARAMAVEWAQGFIAGHNVYARGGSEVANSVVADTKVLVPLLDNYCQKNPESRILSGVLEITQSLGGARVNLTPKGVSPQIIRPDPKTGRES